MKHVLYSRVWAMPHKYTFRVVPLRAIVDRYKMAGETWADPFSGFYSPAELTNDLDPYTPAQSHVDAGVFMASLPAGSIDGVIFDPPYSPTQVARSYRHIGLPYKSQQNPTGGFPVVRHHIARIVKPGGHVISYGWNTVGMGKKRGFEPIEYLICSHGGHHNDTLVVVEQKQR